MIFPISTRLELAKSDKDHLGVHLKYQSYKMVEPNDVIFIDGRSFQDDVKTLKDALTAARIDTIFPSKFV